MRSITHPPRTKKNPAKIVGRNSDIAPTATCLGVRLRAPCLQPDADSQVETRKTRITRADFRRVFPIRTEAPPSMLGWDYRGQGGRAGVMSNEYNNSCAGAHLRLCRTYRLDKFSHDRFLGCSTFDLTDDAFAVGASLLGRLAGPGPGHSL